MKKEEKEYYLRIINLLESMVQGYGSKNFSKMVTAQKELDEMKKSSFEVALQKMKQEKEDKIKRIRNLVSEIASVINTL